MVSVDSRDARRWLELSDDASRADLFGIVDEPDGSITVDLVEVKTYQDPEHAYRISGGEISGDAVSQILNTARIVDEIFQLDPERQRIVSPQRREVLRQQLFRECFFEGRSDEEKQHWSRRLNELFALDVKLRVRLSLVLVGLTQARASTERHLNRTTGSPGSKAITWRQRRWRPGRDESEKQSSPRAVAHSPLSTGARLLVRSEASSRELSPVSLSWESTALVKRSRRVRLSQPAQHSR